MVNVGGRYGFLHKFKYPSVLAARIAIIAAATPSGSRIDGSELSHFCTPSP
jgi:hypothetical protein